MLLGLNRLVFAVSNAIVLSNPADFMADKSKGKGHFKGFQSLLEGYFADAYQLMIVIGVCFFVLALLVAALLFGVLKDSAKVKEHKAWIMRILIAVAIFSLALSLVGLAFDVGSEAGTSGTGTPTAAITTTWMA